MSAARQAIATTSRHALATITPSAYNAAVVPCLLCCRRRATRLVASAGRKRFIGTEASSSQPNLQAPPPPSTSLSELPGSPAAPASDIPSPPNEPPQPTLDDLLAYLPRNLRIPKETDLTDSTDFALYARRFNHILLNLDKAFARKQISVLAARHLKMSRAEANKASKKTLVRRIVTDLWQLPDPQVRLAKEKKVDRGATRESRTVEEQIPLLEKELFLLLSKSNGRDLLQRMASKTGTKASVRGSHPGSLSVTGLPEEVEAFKGRWKQVQSEIRTVELDTGIPAGLRADLYKPLSVATETFVSPAASDAARVEVTYRGTSRAPIEAVEAMLCRLASRDALSASVPRLAVFSQEGMSNFAAIPHVLREAPPWYLSSLPLYGLSRITSVVSDEPARESDGAVQTRSMDGSGGTVGDCLQAAMGGLDGVTVKASFGHHLLIRPGASRFIEASSFLKLAGMRDSHTFMHSPPPSLLSLIQTGREFSKLRLESSNIRRLLYAPKLPTPPFDYISLERVMPGPKELAKSDEAHNADVWTAQRGRQASVDVLMPHASVDIRFTGYKEEYVEDAALLEPFSGISRAIPETLEGYHLMEDSIIRKTVFMRGLSDVWQNYSVVMERISDKLHQGAKSIRVTVEPQRSTGLAGCADMVEDFKSL